MAGPVRLATVPRDEAVSLNSLIQTDNKLFNKVILIFAYLCDQVEILKQQAQAHFYAPLLLLAEGEDLGGEGEAPQATQRPEAMAAALLPLLFAMQQFVARANSLAINLLHQLASLYVAKQRQFSATFKNVHLRNVFASLADLLGLLIYLDDVLERSHQLKLALAAYRRALQHMRAEPAKYASSARDLSLLEARVAAVEGELMHGTIFRTCIRQHFDVPGMLTLGSNAHFMEELAEAVRWGAAQLDGAQPEAPPLVTAPGVAALFLLHQKLAGGSSRQPDQKLYKAVWAALKQAPLVHLAGRAQWRPLAFLAQQLPLPAKAMNLQAAEARAVEWVKQLDADLPREIQAASAQVGAWSVRFASDRSHLPNKRALLEASALLIVDGLRLARRVGGLVRGFLCAHLELSMPMTKATLRQLVHGIMLLKTIEASFHAQLGWVASTAHHAALAFRLRLRKLLLPPKQRLEAARRLDDAALDRLAALTLALQSLEGAPSRQRRLLLELALHVAQLKGALREAELAEVRELQARLRALCEWQPQLEAACECSFLFYARPLLPTLLRYAASAPHPQLLPSLMQACRDIAPTLRLGEHLGARPPSAGAAGWPRAYAAHLLATLERQLIAPLCLSAETDLRLSNHAAQALRSDKAEKPQAKVVHELMRLVALPPLAIFGVLLDPRRRVAHHLDRTFYNLSTVALHDWQRYTEMRALATSRFGLQMVAPHLPAAACVPGQILEQGLDVLQIMRNIHIFVRLHRYNLNQQLFVESDSDAKYLSTIGIKHIAASMRTHGLGIMNTTVNFTYQLLKQKLFVCSQFLFDDHIKSRLIKDARFFRQEREAVGNRYPFDRAERFVRDVRKLGVSEAGLTVLDRFRQLITEIGNAMGYVRMVRAGGLHYAATALGCAPGTVELPDLNALAAEAQGEVAAPGEAGRHPPPTAAFDSAEAAPAARASSPLTAHSADAAANLARVLERTRASFEEGATYFHKLESVFAEEMRSPKNSHLQTFFILVPALTINFVEHLLAAKDKLQRGQLGAAFTDDGFAMGLAYLLNLLAQNTDFEALHWFECVKSKYAAERKQLAGRHDKRARRASKGEDELSLAMRRIESYELEFELLYYAYNGARLFFST